MPTVGEYCSRDLVVAGRNDGMLAAAKRMRERHVGCLIVVDEAEAGQRPVGILTDRDIVVGVLAQSDRGLQLVSVEDVMTANVAVAQEDDDLSDALLRMRSFGVRRMPVVDGRGQLVGLISFDDLVVYVQEEMNDLAELLGGGRRRERALRP